MLSVAEASVNVCYRDIPLWVPKRIANLYRATQGDALTVDVFRFFALLRMTRIE